MYIMYILVLIIIDSCQFIFITNLNKKTLLRNYNICIKYIIFKMVKYDKQLDKQHL